MTTSPWLRRAEDRLIEHALVLSEQARLLSDKEVRDHPDLVRLAINYAADAERILDGRQTERH